MYHMHIMGDKGKIMIIIKIENETNENSGKTIKQPWLDKMEMAISTCHVFFNYHKDW